MGPQENKWAIEEIWAGKVHSLLRFTYQGSCPDSQWTPYFKGALIGADYAVLIENQFGHLVMCNTPIEVTARKKFLRMARGDVLIVGLGINLVNDEIATCQRVTSVTTIEIDRDLIDRTACLHTVFEGDATVFHSELAARFDTVLFDGFCACKLDILRKYLRPEGEIILWDMEYSEPDGDDAYKSTMEV